MDLFFLPSYGHPFSIKAGYFDTVFDIKQKIQEYKGIPVSQQTLIFNGKTLTDDLLCYTELLDCSRINLLISPDADPPPPPPPPPSTTHAYHPILPELSMNLFFLPSHGNPFSMEVGYFNTVLDIKMNIQKHLGIPVSKQTLIFNGKTLPDDLLSYMELLDCSCINLLISPDADPPPPPPPPPSTTHAYHPVYKLAMNLFFLPSHGNPFSMIVGYFNTVLEIKMKIQKDLGIPVSKQTLILNGNTLPDDLFVYSGILDRSRINLLISPDADPTPPPPPPPSTKIQLLLKVPSSETGKPLEADIHDTIQRLKEKIQETEGVHASRIFMHVNGIELQDFKTVHDCGLSDNSEINVGFRPVRLSSSGRQSPTKMKVFVLPYRGKEKVPVDVSPSDIVGVLREKIEKMRLDLPRGGYCFIYNRNVMRDDQSFQWHNVSQGDTIEIS